MPFRFNQKDLTGIATQSSEQFNKEGLLWFKEKEGKLFNKGESFTERFFRLRGNLLFYFKGKDKNTECTGVIVLERFGVIASTHKKYGFTIEFEDPDEQKYEFTAPTKQDYDEWIGLFKHASYEKLRNHMLKLRGQILAITGQDPLPDYYPIVAWKNVANSRKRMSLFTPNGPEVNTDDVLMEMCIACSNLMPSYDTIPSAMVKIFTVVPPDTEWEKHSHTEISEESRDPNFLRTTVFSSKFTPLTRVKFVVYDVLSKSKSDTVTIGQAICTLQQIQQSATWSIILSIMNMESTVGNLIIQGWKRETSSKLKEGSMSNSNLDCRDDILFNMPRTYVTNVVQRNFRFPTRNGNDSKFQEFLAESTLCFKLPKMLLNLFIGEEKECVVELHNIGPLHPEWERMKLVVQNTHFDFVHQYSTNLADLSQFEQLNFKRSVNKTKKELEFIPTNLHLQRLCVLEKDNKEFCYDVVTVGAPTAHAMKFKHGGLRRLIASAEENTRKALQGVGSEENRKSSYIKAKHVRDVIRRTLAEITDMQTEIQNAIEMMDCDMLKESATQMSVKLCELRGLQDTTFVENCEKLLLKARTNGPALQIKSTIISSDIDIADYKDLVWEWTGTEFKGVRSSQTEGDCGVCDALVELMSAVNSTCNTNSFDNVEYLLSLVESLKSCIKSLALKINVTMRFILMQDEADCPGLKELRYRRDVVFSQTLTPVVAGFVLMLSQRIRDHTFWEQLMAIGLLVHYESLLTTSGDEMAMIEDMNVGVSDLKSVTFKIVSSESALYPMVSGNRATVTIEFPLKPRQFSCLPKQLQERQIIHLHPVMFSVGINEQAILAERFGDTSLQEAINAENSSYLQIYFDAFLNHFPDYVGSRSPNAVSLSNLMEQLKTSINTKKSKNYEILLLSEELCFRLNGIRLTSCKSAKDRSSMSVTLEEIRTLEREHNMKEDVCPKVLNSVRSQGTRLINSYKNVGLPKYAFNKVQVKALPSVYRPPEGTIGKYLQT